MDWRDQTKRCLQEELLQAYDQGTHTCTDVQTAAFVSHPRCYTNHSHSICFAPVLEAATVVGLVDTEEFFKQESLRQMAATAGICINQIIARMGFFLQDEDETLDHKLIFWQDTKTRLEERLDPVITLR